MNKRTNPFKVFIANVKKLFNARSLIIVSDNKVEHLPLSGTMQLLLIVGFLGFFSGISYITGSYMSARSVINEKDQKIASTTTEKVRISEEMNLLKSDLSKLDKNNRELTSYSKFVADQYSDPLSQSMTVAAFATNTSGKNIFDQGDNKLRERVEFLEKRIKEIKTDNEQLIAAIRERTNKKIDFFEDVISMTGLNPEKLENAALENKAAVAAEKIVKTGNIINDETAEKENIKSDPKESGAKGGPFIPYQKTSFLENYDRDAILANVDKLVLLNDIVAELPLAKPIKDAQPMSPFGRRSDPFTGRLAMHPGLDLAGATGSPIYATSNGVIESAGRNAAYGNAIDISHGFGIVTRYAHLSKILVKEGDKVKKGQKIGIQGSTGRSTGAHLHYEVRINDSPVNPIKFLNAGEYVLEN